MAIAATLKKDIYDYRDHEIATEKSPRRVSGTSFDAEGRTRIAANSIYPKDTDTQIESKTLHDLARGIGTYISQVIAFIQSNGDKTKLKTNSI